VNRRNPILERLEAAPLTARLGNCPEAIAIKTLEATTQLQNGKLNMDQRDPKDESSETWSSLHPATA